jgi:hypothetical protein
MADDEVPKVPPSDSQGPLNKAQQEFQRYLKRVQATLPGGGPAVMMPMGFAPGESMPGWAVPPSVAMLPHAPASGGFFVPMVPGGTPGDGSLLHRLGSTVGLGVDVINAALAGGVRLLNGIAGGHPGFGEYGHGQEGCGCEACRPSCCDSGCCGSDCCGGCDCCRPSVGNCC